jgi:hypothetical protein
MTKISQIAGRSNFAFNQNTTSFVAITSTGVTSSTTEANIQKRVRTPGVYSNLYVRVITNTLTGTCTIRFRKNGANGNQVITIGAGLTGEFTDAINFDTVVATDLISASVVCPAGGTSIILVAFGPVFNADAGLTACTYNATQSAFYTANATRNFMRLGGAQLLVGSESIADQIRIKIAADLKWYQTIVGTNARTTTTFTGLRKNGADGSNVNTIGAGLTGLFEDTINTDALVIGDLVNRFILGGASTENFNAIQSAEIISVAQQVQYVCQGTQAVAAASTRFDYISGNCIFASTEVDVQRPIQFIARASLANVYVSANATSGNSVFTLRKNGVDTAITITVGAAATGFFEDTTNTVDFLPTDQVDWKVVTGASGLLTVERSSIVFTNIESSGGRKRQVIQTKESKKRTQSHDMQGATITMRAARSDGGGTGSGSTTPDDLWFYRRRRLR